MKKVLFLFAAIMMTANLFAQEQEALLECHGNTYFCGKEAMSRRQMLDWYAQRNCQAAYMQFAKGQRMANAGWAFLGIGVAMDLGSAVCAGMYVYKTVDYCVNSSSSTKESELYGYLASSIGLGVVGGAFELACVPLLVVGYHKMHSSVDVYNVSCSLAKTQPYWSIQSSKNGLGLALNF